MPDTEEMKRRGCEATDTSRCKNEGINNPVMITIRKNLEFYFSRPVINLEI